MFITGNISTEELVDKTGTYSRPPSKDAILNRVSEETGVDPTGLFCYRVNDKDIQDRILLNEDFDLIWENVELGSGTGIYQYQITSLDFTPEDSKNYLYFSVSKEDFDADGTDEVRINVQMKTPDLSGVVDYNDKLNILSVTPNGQAKLGFRFFNGKASKAISTTKAGVWQVPASVVSGYKVKNSVEFNSVL